MKQARGSKLKNNWPVKKINRLLFFMGEFGVRELLRVGAGVCGRALSQHVCGPEFVAQCCRKGH